MELKVSDRVEAMVSGGEISSEEANRFAEFLKTCNNELMTHPVITNSTPAGLSASIHICAAGSVKIKGKSCTVWATRLRVSCKSASRSTMIENIKRRSAFLL